MTGNVPTDLDLSSCVLCGGPLDGEGTVRSYGGTAVEVHGACAREGLEGKDLASSRDSPGADGAGGGGSAEAAEPNPSAEADPSAAPSEADGGPEPGADEGGTEAGDGAGSGGAGRDPGWTRITDFG